MTILTATLTPTLAPHAAEQVLPSLTRAPIANADAMLVVGALGRVDVITVVVRDSYTALQSIRNDVLITQAARLRQLSPWSYLIITGVLAPSSSGHVVTEAGERTGWRWDAWQGALLTIQELGVGVITIRNADDVVPALVRLCDRSRDARKIPPMREALFTTPGENILQSIEGIGDATCAALLEHCRTPAAALMALTMPGDAHVPGIGAKTQEAARRALGLPTGAFVRVVAADAPAHAEYTVAAQRAA